MESFGSNPNKTVKRRRRMVPIVISLLSIALLISVIKTVKTEIEKKEAFEQSVQMKRELDALMVDFNAIQSENSNLVAILGSKDSIIQANALEIKKLIVRQEDYTKIQKKLDLLREITKEYVHRIDSLQVANEILTLENTQIKEEIAEVRKENTSLVEEKSKILEKLELASVFKIYNIESGTVRLRPDGREIPTDKASRLDRVSISFILGENSLAEKGGKTIYARISRPDGKLLIKDESENYSFKDATGNTLQFSIKEDINYDGFSQKVNMVWVKSDKKQAAMVGRYDVMLYMDGREVGRSGFEVRP